MIKVVFRNDSGDEKIVEYTEEEISRYGRAAVIKISDQTLELAEELKSYRVVEEV